jgi:hypothetical protein
MCSRDRIELVYDSSLRNDLTGQPQIDRDVAVDGHHDVAGVDLGACRCAGEQDRFAYRFTEGRNPEVVLEFGERLGERLSDRSGAVDRPARHTQHPSRDWSRLQQPQLAVVADRPLDVLRGAEHAGDLVGQRRQAPK